MMLSPRTTAASIPSQMPTSAQEPTLRRTGDMLQSKCKVGRPPPQKTLIKMAELTVVQKKDVNCNSKLLDWVEEKGTAVRQEVTSHKHKKVFKGTQKTESAFQHLRRSSRIAKPVEITDFTLDPTQHVSPPSGHTEPFLMKEDLNCTLSTTSPNTRCGAEAAPQSDIPSVSKGRISSNEGPDLSDIPTQSLPEIEPSDGCIQTAAKKSKQGISVLETTSSSVPQEDSNAAQDNGASAQTLITPLSSQQQKPLKPIKYKKGNKANHIHVSNTTELFGVCGLSPVLGPPVGRDAETSSQSKKQLDVTQQSDFHPSEKKTSMKCVTSTKAKKSRTVTSERLGKTNEVDLSTSEIFLGETPVCSPQSVHGSKLKNKNSSVDSMKHPTEKLTRESPLIKVQTPKGSSSKLNNADLTSNPKTESKRKQIKGKKANNLDLSNAPSHPTADENLPLPLLNPAIAEKPECKISSLATSTVSQPVSASLPTPSEKGQVSETMTTLSLKRKQPLKVISPKKREDTTSKPILLNCLNVSNDKDLVNYSEMDSMLNEMENGPKRKRVTKTDDNVQCTHPKSVVHSTVTENKRPPVAGDMKLEKSTLPPSDAIPSPPSPPSLPSPPSPPSPPSLPSSESSKDEGKLPESVSPDAVKRPQLRGKLSKRKCRSSGKKRLVNNTIDLSTREIKPLESVKAPIDKAFTAKDAHAVVSSVEEVNKLADLGHCTSPSGRNAKDIAILLDSSNESVAELDNTLWESTDAPNRSKSPGQSETITSDIMDVSCDSKIQKVRQQTRGAKGATGTSEAVHENMEAANRPSTAGTTLLHSNVKLRRSITCRSCGHTFRHITAYSVHKCTHTGKKPYRCLKCGKRFAQLSKLCLHANIHRPPDPVRCPCCSGRFPNKAELILHFQIHMKETKKVCLIENEAQRREIPAQMPANNTLSPVRQNTSTSLTCHSSFNNTLDICTLPTNIPVKPYICRVCGLKFDKSSSYYIHGRTHRHPQPYACSVCGEGFDQLRKLKAHSRTHSGKMPSSAARCDDSSCGLSTLQAHPTSEARSETTDEVAASTVDGFLVHQGVDGRINTPIFFKCRICKQLHRHWCQYVLHLQTHTKVSLSPCDVCGQQYNQVSKMSIHCKVCCKKSGEERACNASLSEVLQEPPSSQNRTLEHLNEILPGDRQERSSPPSSSEMSCGSRCRSRQRARTLSGLLANTQHRRYACAQCGKSFSQWNKLWVHHRTHRLKGRRFPCTLCKLEFYYFRSYRDHMQEHAALSSFVCPLCPEAFVASEDFTTHLHEHLNPCKCLKCDTCGKCFKSFQGLERHGRLHKGANSNHCLLCNVSFRRTSALQDHLKTHKSLLRTPVPVEPVEPFLYPYHCRKCKARFTSTDLLQAHQVFHLNPSSKAVPPQTLSSFHQPKTPSKPNTLPVCVSRKKKTCHVTKRSSLFQYPHPDRLYVIPVQYSEPPVVISDTEDPQVIVTTPLTPSSLINNMSHTLHNGHSNGLTKVTVTQSTQPTPKSTTVLPNDYKLRRQATTPLCHASSGPLGRDPVPNVLSHVRTACKDEDADDEYEDDDLVDFSVATATPEELECEGFGCAVCQATFTEVSDLHDHYVHHARGAI